MDKYTGASTLVLGLFYEIWGLEVFNVFVDREIGNEKKYRGIAGGLYHGCQGHLRLLPE